MTRPKGSKNSPEPSLLKRELKQVIKLLKTQLKGHITKKNRLEKELRLAEETLRKLEEENGKSGTNK